ncbi:MAG TPA: 2Fe-2S iron-sulfur cluster-binding protein [Steroidobacter sp.]|jgi:ring-1,2-phenylacetyl-CoA epoxidase subunit PaaE|nr:2Fe-2S iron-sulfur cluster-binding protein [Steroidobacter sp.]
MLKFHPLKVTSRTEVAEDAVCISFETPPELRDFYRFEAGQHLAIRLPIAGGEVRRTYSIVSPMGGADLRIGVRVQPGGQGSSWLAKSLQVGDTLEVLTPNGSFHTRIEPQRAKRYVAFAAGSGITPVLSIMATVLAQEPHSRFILFYGNRTTASTMFLEEVLALKNRYPARFSVHCLMSQEPQDIALLNGRLDREKIRKLASVFFRVDAVDEYFVCGPGTMVEDATQTLRELGAAGKIHTELFATSGRSPEIPSGRDKVSRHKHETTQVTVVMDGRRRTFSMPSDGVQSVLDAAARVGVELPYSCRAGVCSTCRARVVKGAVRMDRNQALEDWEVEGGYVLCCQSHPTTPELELTYDE